MRKNRTINYYSDPGHGWIKVSLKEIARLGIANRISGYSYVNKGFAFLEEDCDAGVYINCLKAVGVEFKVAHHIADRSSKIRNYRRYTPEQAI